MFLISGCKPALPYVDNRTDKPIGAITSCEYYWEDDINTITMIIPAKTMGSISRCDCVKLITAKNTIGTFDTGNVSGFVVNRDEMGRYVVSTIERKSLVYEVVIQSGSFIVILVAGLLIFLIFMAIEVILVKRIVFLYAGTKYFKITIVSMVGWIVLISLLYSFSSYVSYRDFSNKQEKHLYKEKMLDGINRTLVNEIRQVYHE